MIKKLLYWVAVGLFPASAIATTSTVTANVTDTDGQAWSYGTVTAKLSLPGGPFGNIQVPTIGGAAVPTTVSGIMNAAGAFSLSLTDTTSLDQNGGQWTITACPNASITANSTTGCAIVTTGVVGASVNLTSRFTGVVAPRFPAGPDAFGYLDIEVSPTPAIPGSRYYNTSTSTTLQGLRLWDGKQWTGVGGIAGGAAGGDLAGTYPNPSVVKLNGNPVTNTAPTNTSMTPVWNGAAYSARQLSLDDLTPAFAINSFSGGQTVEIGASVVNPAFTASYSYTPNTAAITNTDNISSPTNLISPFTSGTVAGTFFKTTQTSTTFTLTATAATTKTATQTIAWSPRVFGGVGLAAATSATASGTNAILSGGSGTLSNAGLSNSQVNQIFGPYSPANQKIYLLILGNSHTNIVDNLTGFAMPFNTPTPVTFTNQNGSTVAMYLYESTNLLSGTFSPKVAN